MTTLPLGPVADDLRRLHRSLLVAVFVMVTIVGIGLVFGWDLVTRVQPAWPQIYPYTVAGIAALAIAIALFDAGRTAGIWVARVLAGGTLLAGASVDLAVARGLLPSTDAPTGGASAWFAALPSLATMSMAAAVLLLGSDRPAAARVGCKGSRESSRCTQRTGGPTVARPRAGIASPPPGAPASDPVVVFQENCEMLYVALRERMRAARQIAATCPRVMLTMNIR